MRHIVSLLLLFVIWMSLSFFLGISHLNPKGPMLIALMLGFLVAFLPFPRRMRSLKDALAAITVYALFLGGIRILRDAPISRYLTAYHGIRVGMSLAEAQGVIQRELPYCTRPIDGNLDDGWVRFEPTRENYNADHMDVLMFHGKVAEIGAVPD